MKSWYQIKNRSNGEIEISIMEEIGGWGVSAKSFRDDLKHLGETEPIHLHINSDGGDIFAGNEIYNALMEHKGKVRVSVGALAASMASVIAMAGDEISIAENGMLMVHDPWTIFLGDAEEMRKTADTLDDLKAGIVKAYQRQTNLDPAAIAALMSDETWMTAEEAQQLGFVDSIIQGDKADTEQARNFSNIGRFRNSAAFINQLRRNNNSVKTKENLLNKSGNGDDSPDGQEAIAAERNRCKEIQDIAALVLKNDKKDFSNEARKAIVDGVSSDEFAKAIVTSDRFKSQFIVGSGEEDDGLDFDRNSLGALVANHPDYRRMVEQGGLQKGQSLVMSFPINYGKLRKAMRPRAATLTGLPGTGIEILPNVAGLNIEQLKVADLAINLGTSGSSVRYISETSFTNAAGTVAEGAAKPEQSFNLTEVDSPVRKVAVWTKCSDEVLADHSRLASFINTRLQMGVELKLDEQIVNGNGTPPNLTGILNFAGIQTRAKGADTHFDAIRKAITQIRKFAFVEPDAIVLHPDDDEEIAILKDSAGQYLGGGPRTGAYGQGAFQPNTPIWNLPPIVTTAIAAGTVLVGRFRYGAEVYWRQGVIITMTNSDQDDFIKNLITIRCELRAALAVPHPVAFCQVTGM